jgi:hypothetical protein
MIRRVIVLTLGDIRLTPGARNAVGFFCSECQVRKLAKAVQERLVRPSTESPAVNLGHGTENKQADLSQLEIVPLTYPPQR